MDNRNSSLPSGTLLEIRAGKVEFLGASGVRSGIAKSVLHGPVSIGPTGIVSDEQAESFHGGKDKAILQYDLDHYRQWALEFPTKREGFVSGGFGENFVVEGMNEETMYIGDLVRVGTVLLEVSETRQPCFKLNHRFGVSAMARKAQASGRTGWFYRVWEAGQVVPGDSIRVIARPNPEWSVRRLQHFLYQAVDDTQAASALSSLPQLSEGFRTLFSKRLAQGVVENWEDRLWNGPLESNANRRWFEATVADIESDSSGAKIFRLVPTASGSFPIFEPGAHIEVKIANSTSRCYSLTRLSDGKRYEIAVQRSAQSRGGSAFMHDGVTVGTQLQISEPRNFFPLATGASKHIFIAGGIGVTPFLPMIEKLEHDRSDWELHLCVPTIERAPYLKYLMSIRSGCINIHTSDASSGLGRLNISELLEVAIPDFHIYCCGSGSLMQAVRDAVANWPEENIHFESFGDAGASPAQQALKAFEIHLSAGERLQVPTDLTILEVLREAGYEIPSSCETGVCGTCAIKYLSGDIDHRDTVLTSKEKQTCLIPCVSRAISQSIAVAL